MSKDNRRARRDRHDSVVEIFENGALKCTGRLADFSSAGISFSSDSSFEKGEAARVRLRLLGRGVMDAEGQVVWARKEKGRFFYGFRFDSLKEVHPTGEKKEPWD